jgi:hypothetical protein
MLVRVRGMGQGLEQELGEPREAEPRRKRGQRLGLDLPWPRGGAARRLTWPGSSRLPLGNGSGTAGRAGQARQRRKTRVALVPPNPKPFEIANSTSAFRATFGT